MGKRNLCVIIACLALAAPAIACGVPASVSDTPKRPENTASLAEVQQVVDTFRRSIIAKDRATLENLFVPNGSSWFEVLSDRVYARLKGKDPKTTKLMPGGYKEFASYIGSAKQRIEEKFSNVRIDTDGSIATVYFNYVFLIDSKESNRGNETWQLLNTGDGWRISALSYSVVSVTPE